MSNNHHQHHLSDDDSAGPALPRGCVKQRGGWEGEELELERQLDPSIDAATATTHAAVDLSQFRNTQVGKGYQAKHVIRQRSAAPQLDPAVSIVQDRTKKEETSTAITSNSKTATKSKKRHAEELPSKELSSTKTTRQLQAYLQCEGLRKFRKELESIHSPDT